MVETYFPDGTTLSSLAPNTANLLAGITPTFTGFSTNPATNSELVNELDVDSLTTEGYIPADTAGVVQYDLGASKRIIAHMYYYYAGVASQAFIEVSDNGSAWSWAYYETGVSAAQDVNATTVAKCRYVRFYIYNKDASFGSGIDILNLRAYQL